MTDRRRRVDTEQYSQALHPTTSELLDLEFDVNPYGFDWSWQVIVIEADGSRRVRWLCDSEKSAADLRDSIQDAMMVDVDSAASVWVEKADS